MPAPSAVITGQPGIGAPFHHHYLTNCWPSHRDEYLVVLCTTKVPWWKAASHLPFPPGAIHFCWGWCVSYGCPVSIGHFQDYCLDINWLRWVPDWSSREVYYPKHSIFCHFCNIFSKEMLATHWKDYFKCSDSYEPMDPTWNSSGVGYVLQFILSQLFTFNILSVSITKSA